MSLHEIIELSFSNFSKPRGLIFDLSIWSRLSQVICTLLKQIKPSQANTSVYYPALKPSIHITHPSWPYFTLKIAKKWLQHIMWYTMNHCPWYVKGHSTSTLLEMRAGCHICLKYFASLIYTAACFTVYAATPCWTIGDKPWSSFAWPSCHAVF